MEGILTIFLIRTISLRPTGLKVKLKIVSVNKHCVTFDESNIPAATFMPHGLFLGYPTAPGTKNPQLLGVLNLKQMGDPEPLVGLAVYWGCGIDPSGPTNVELMPTKSLVSDMDEPQSPTSNAVSGSHRISLAKYGVVKDIPSSAALDGLVEEWLGKNPSDDKVDRRGSWTIPVPAYGPVPTNGRLQTDYSVGTGSQTGPIPAHDVCKALIRAFLLIEKSVPQTSESSPEAEDPAVLDTKFFSYLQAIKSVLQAALNTVEYLETILPPTLPADVRLYETVCSAAHDELRQLVSIILDLLLGPIGNILARTSKPKGGLLHRLHRNITTSKTLLEQLYENASLKSAEKSAIATHTRLPPLCPSRKEDCFDANSILSCFEVPEIRQRYLNDLQTRLAADVPSVGYEQRVFERVVTARTFCPRYPHRALITESGSGESVGQKLFGPVLDLRFCCCRRAKSSKVTRFGTSLDKLDGCEMVAIVCHGITKICIMMRRGNTQEAESLTLDEQEDPLLNIMFVNVFRGETEVGSFNLGWNPMIQLRADEAKSHFTGRYYSRFRPFGWGQLMVLDLLPCMQEYPAAPKMAIQSLVDFELHDNPSWLLHLGFTDEFLSYLKLNVTQSPQRGTVSIITTSLCIVELDMTSGPKNLVVIPLDEPLSHIPNDVWNKDYHVQLLIHRNICWTKDARRLYYTVYKLDKCSSLAVIAFDVTRSQGSVRTLAWSMSEPDEQMRARESSSNRILIKTLQTAIREYLVIDLIEPATSGYVNQENAWRVLSRCLFTVHKRLIHRVRVDGQLSHAPPEVVGYPIRNLGYSTVYLQLFHHRRAFHADKVVSAIHRLEYKSL